MKNYIRFVGRTGINMDLIVHRICVGCSKYEKQSIIDIDKLKIKFRKTKRRSKFAVIF